ncbi:MAG: hypothetical protein M3144_07745, partial [Actinomycetota bacterium]|nr:hypothetical protein [Actinomycetota bacterium]
VWEARAVEDGWEPAVTLPPGPRARCLTARGDELFIGTAEARLFRLAGGTATRLGSFDEAEGRDGWYTPWGGPPDTRSLAVGTDGTLYANVHVGGILRSDDDTASWVPTIDVDADVHQVLAGDGGTVFAATAYGLALSRDRGAHWTFVTAGLHADYSRAVAVAGEWLLLSASTGPSSDRAAVYRRRLDAPDDAPFERCREGLPDWFTGNIDTRCLVASGSQAALATAGGTVYVSEDAGETWREAASGLGRVTSLALAG